MDTRFPVPWFQCAVWWAITLLSFAYYQIVEWRIYWATIKIPLDKSRDATFPLSGRRSDYVNFAFVATFLGVASLWFGFVDFAGARLGWGFLIPALLLGKWLRWGMKMRLRWFVFEDEQQRATNLTP